MDCGVQGLYSMEKRMMRNGKVRFRISEVGRNQMGIGSSPIDVRA